MIIFGYPCGGVYRVNELILPDVLGIRMIVMLVFRVIGCNLGLFIVFRSSTCGGNAIPIPFQWCEYLKPLYPKILCQPAIMLERN